MDIAGKVAPRKTARSRKLAPWANGQWLRCETSATKAATGVCSQILFSSLPKTPLASVMYNSLLLLQIDRLTGFIGAQKQFTTCCCYKLEFVSLAGNLILQDAGYLSSASKTGLMTWKAMSPISALRLSSLYLDCVLFDSMASAWLSQSACEVYYFRRQWMNGNWVKNQSLKATRHRRDWTTSCFNFLDWNDIIYLV